VKVLPTPGVLSTVRSPPMPRARSRLIASPSPTPACVRVSRWSACTNGSKMRSSASAAMPAPVSRTWSRTRPPSARAARRTRHLDAPRHAVARLGELDRVAEQVEQDLLQLLPVGPHVESRRHTRPRVAEPLRRSCGATSASASATASATGTSASRYVDRARLDARVVEHPGDEPEQVALARLDARERGALRVGDRARGCRARSAPRSRRWRSAGVRSSWRITARNSLFAGSPRRRRRRTGRRDDDWCVPPGRRSLSPEWRPGPSRTPPSGARRGRRSCART
jgi:hypothetical protein